MYPSASDQLKCIHLLQAFNCQLNIPTMWRHIFEYASTLFKMSLVAYNPVNKSIPLVHFQVYKKWSVNPVFHFSKSVCLLLLRGKGEIQLEINREHPEEIYEHGLLDPDAIVRTDEAMVVNLIKPVSCQRCLPDSDEYFVPIFTSQ